MQITTSAAALATTLLLASTTAAYSLPPSDDNNLYIRGLDDRILYIRDHKGDKGGNTWGGFAKSFSKEFSGQMKNYAQQNPDVVKGAGKEAAKAGVAKSGRATRHVDRNKERYRNAGKVGNALVTREAMAEAMAEAEAEADANPDAYPDADPDAEADADPEPWWDGQEELGWMEAL